MSLSEALSEIMEESERVISQEAIGLHTDLLVLSGGAMKKTGNFNRSFSIKRLGKLRWRISNSAEYAGVLAGGRRFVNGKFVGSINWSGGLTPMLEKTSNDITEKLNRIRR